MFSFTTLVLSLSLLASKPLGSPNLSGLSRHARWLQTPRALLDPEFLKRDSLEARALADIELSPLEKKDIFQRQTSSCNPGEVECQGNKCCPAGYNCYYYSGTAGCCAVGRNCTGPPVGCADPNSLECPASIGGCCPIGEACYRDSGGVARCDNTGLYSNSVPAPSTAHTTTTPTFIPITTTTLTLMVTTTTTNLATLTVIRNGAEKMFMGVGALAVMMGALVALG